MGRVPEREEVAVEDSERYGEGEIERGGTEFDVVEA